MCSKAKLCVQIRTLNYEGRKKRGKHGYYRRNDYKKAYVTLDPPEQHAGVQS